MDNHTQQIVNKARSYAHLLREDGLSYMAYTEQITFLLFLKMADEQDKKPARQNAWTRELWVYDLRTNARFTLKQNPMRRHHLDEFADLYNPENRQDRQPTWSEENLEGRWRSFGCEEPLKRDKVSLDLFWLRDESLEDSANLPDPDVIAQEITEDLQTALDQFATIAADLKER